jgi:hypothetical protein
VRVAVGANARFSREGQQTQVFILNNPNALNALDISGGLV